VKALPWDNPMMLALAFSFVLLGFGGAGGLINMSYQLDETVHNTQWITGHFHLIFGGAIVIMYLAVAYDLWPELTGGGPLHVGLMKWQLWLWFVGMLVLTLPWHWVGLLGMPRRMAYYDYSHPAIAPQAWTVVASTIGGALLVVSGILFLVVLARGHARGAGAAAPGPYTFSRAVHEGVRPPAVLNGHGLWVAMMIALTVVNYGYPIAQLAVLKVASVPIIPIGTR
jgi:cytochrome c oxidase subunit 1